MFKFLTPPRASRGDRKLGQGDAVPLSILQMEAVNPEGAGGAAGEVVAEHTRGAGDNDMRRYLRGSGVFQGNLNLLPAVGTAVGGETAVGDYIGSPGIEESFLARGIHLYGTVFGAAIFAVIPISQGYEYLTGVRVSLLDGFSLGIASDIIDCTTLVFHPESHLAGTKGEWTAEIDLAAAGTHKARELTAEDISGGELDYHVLGIEACRSITLHLVCGIGIADGCGRAHHRGAGISGIPPLCRTGTGSGVVKGIVIR